MVTISATVSEEVVIPVIRFVVIPTSPVLVATVVDVVTDLAVVPIPVMIWSAIPSMVQTFRSFAQEPGVLAAYSQVVSEL